MYNLEQFFSAQPVIQPIPLTLITDSDKSLSFYILREDTLHTHISGNKWHKLKENIYFATQQGYQEIGSFGGFFSNHLHALAYLGKLQNLKTIGVVRGQKPITPNPTLTDCLSQEMKLIFASRNDYKSTDFQQQLQKNNPQTFWIPEGGNNDFGIKGCANWAQKIIASDSSFDYWLLASGTACTAFGLWLGLYQQWQQGQKIIPNIISVSVLKGENTFSEAQLIFEKKESIHPSFIEKHRLKIMDGYHYGGFGKSSPVVNEIIKKYHESINLPLDKVYTAKLLLAVEALAKKNFFKPCSKILLIHTGGLQGNRI